MDEKMLLNALGKMFDERDNKLSTMMDEKLDERDKKLSAMMDEKLGERDKKLSAMMDEKLDKRDKKNEDKIMLDFNTVIENKVSKEIRLIAEQHGSIIARLPDADEQFDLKSRLRVLERVVTDLRVEVDRLRKAQ